MATKNKGGRPKFEIDYDAVSKLASIMATQEEIATFLGCNVRTLQRDEEFSRVYKRGQENGKMSLRRNQWKLSEKNVAMAIWLGKQYLGQKEPRDKEVETLIEDLTPLAELLKGKNEITKND